MALPDAIREGFMDSKKASATGWQEYEAMRAARELTARENRWSRLENTNSNRANKEQVNRRTRNKTNGVPERKR